MDGSAEVWAEWTPAAVEKRLVAAFRVLPGTAVMGRPQALRLASGAASPMTAIFAWGRFLDDDPEGRTFLFAWARCRALRESFAEYCLDARWSRSTAEGGRRRAAAAIAAALAAAPSGPHLDQRKCD